VCVRVLQMMGQQPHILSAAAHTTRMVFPRRCEYPASAAPRTRTDMIKPQESQDSDSECLLGSRPSRQVVCGCTVAATGLLTPAARRARAEPLRAPLRRYLSPRDQLRAEPVLGLVSCADTLLPVLLTKLLRTSCRGVK